MGLENREIKMEEDLKPLWRCPSCDHTIYSDALDDNEKPIGITIGPLPVTICPNCQCLTLDREMYDEMRKHQESGLITPNTNNTKGLHI